MSNDTNHKIETVPDFIAIGRFSNSLKKLEEKYPDGCPDHVIANALGTTEEEIRLRYLRIVETLKALINPGE